jgi:hypothetical protein
MLQVASFSLIGAIYAPPHLVTLLHTLIWINPVPLKRVSKLQLALAFARVRKAELAIQVSQGHPLRQHHLASTRPGDDMYDSI